MAPRKPYNKTAEPIDQWLELQGFYRKHTARDASCLFRAVAEQVFFTQSCYENVRKQCVKFIQRQKHHYEQYIEGPIENYASRMLSSKEWGGQVEMEAMSLLYSRDIVIFQHPGKPPYAASNNGFKENILLCASSDNHYDSIYPKQYIENAAFCQSVVYEVLYKNVFKLQDVNYAVEKMLHKSSRNRNDNFVNQNYICSSGTLNLSLEVPVKQMRRLEIDYNGELNVRELLARGVTPFPYKVAKALDPNIYRNIEFDIWSDLRREMKLGLLAGVSNGELQVGVKCLVKLQPNQTFHAHIQEMAPDNGPVIVFVEELGQKCTVPHEILEPLPQNQRIQWALPYRQHRQMMNMSAKSSFLALPDFGNKWKKSKFNKQRKMKEAVVPVTISQRVQCLPNGSQQHSLSNRYDQEQNANQLNYPPFPPENFTYTNNASVQTAMEHCPQSPVQHVQSECSADSSTMASQADSTTSSATLVESELTSNAQHSPLQFLPVSLDTSMIPSSSSPLHSNVVCNKPQRAKDINGNLLLQPVNFLAQKSLQLNGSDLPLSDISTLRFYYNLGHDFFHSSCMLWPNPMTPQPPLPSCESSNAQLLPDSTVSPEEEGFHLHPVQPVINAVPIWPSQQPIVGVRMQNSFQEDDHNGQISTPSGQELSVSGSETPNVVPHHPVPQMVEPYNNPTLVPYYSVEMESVQYYTMGSPFSCVIHPSDMDVVPSAPQMQQLQPPTLCSAQMSPLIYQSPHPPMTRWVPSPDGMSQYNVAM